MKLIKLNKVHQGKFLTYYEGAYLNSDNETYTYEFVSRDKNLTIDSFKPSKCFGVAMVIFNEDKTSVLLQKEFRMAVNNYSYCFAAGLIEEGETVEDTCKRELKEETGCDLIAVDAVLPPAYSSQGFSDELIQIAYIRAKGEPTGSCFVNEEISAKWYTKQEVKELFEKKVHMAIRTQAVLYSWINEN